MILLLIRSLVGPVFSRRSTGQSSVSQFLLFSLIFISRCIHFASSYFSFNNQLFGQYSSQSSLHPFKTLISSKKIRHKETELHLFDSFTKRLSTNAIYSFTRGFDFDDDITTIFRQQLKGIFSDGDEEGEDAENDENDDSIDHDDHDYLAERIVQRLQPHSSIINYDLSNIDTIKGFGIRDNEKPMIINHYICPPISIEIWRKRYGRRKSFWGEWSSHETRQFYKAQLPKALQLDGAMGLTLEERAKLASEARYALRLYTRERCHLPGRIFAKLYDGFRHWIEYGTWNDEGMTWPEVKLKYSKQAIEKLGNNATNDQIMEFVYQKIVEKSCATNHFIDEIAEINHQPSSKIQFFRQMLNRLRSGTSSITNSSNSNNNNSGSHL